MSDAGPAWKVRFQPSKVGRDAANLDATSRERLAGLILDIERSGPIQALYPHFSALRGLKGQSAKDKRYHCHLKSGRPTIVACWRAYHTIHTVEIYYVGSHQSAPY